MNDHSRKLHVHVFFCLHKRMVKFSPPPKKKVIFSQIYQQYWWFQTNLFKRPLEFTRLYKQNALLIFFSHYLPKLYLQSGGVDSWLTLHKRENFPQTANSNGDLQLQLYYLSINQISNCVNHRQLCLSWIYWNWRSWWNSFDLEKCQLIWDQKQYLKKNNEKRTWIDLRLMQIWLGRVESCIWMHTSNTCPHEHQILK